jgi:subtilisin family serine protease
MKILIYLLGFLLSANVLSASVIDPYLQIKMNESRGDEMIAVYIVFEQRLRLADFNDIPYDTPRNERRRIVIERLQNFANSHQADVRNFLASQETQRNAEKYEVLWLTNTIVVKANKNVINELASRYDNSLAMIAYDPEYPTEMLRDVNITPTPFLTDVMQMAVEPGIVLMNGDDCWNMGNRGEGVIVANADDGFHWKHPDLVKGIWQNMGEDANGNGMTIIWGSGTSSTFDPGDLNGIDNDGNGKVDDLIGWDFTTNNYNITTASHGSATLGHVTGDGTGGTQTGVAPLAKSIPMRNASTQTQQWLAFQYAVQMGADVVTSSLSWKWNPNTGNPAPPDYGMFRSVTDMSLAAGVVHTNSTSNDGLAVNTTRPIPVNISTAGNVPAPWIHPDQLKVGGIGGVIGVGNVHVSTDLINNDSPYGPSTWGNWPLWGTYTYTIDPAYRDYPYSRTTPVEMPDSMGLIKPDVSAPGQNSVSTYVSSGSGYGTFGGTSSATPHTAGAVALMLSINPEMLPSDVAKVLMLTAVEKGDPGKDNRYGTGRIDVFAATSSPKFTVTGITGPSNMVMNSTLAASDTARELAGLKFVTNVNPKVGSLKLLKFGMTTNATASHITSFDLYFDKNKDNVVSAGDVKLRSLPFQTGPLTFDDLKFKFLDSSRTLILAARTTGTASSSQTVTLGITDTNQVVAYYTTRPFNTNFPFGSVTGVTGNGIDKLTYNLAQNYPNPFNPATIINYTLANDGIVKIKVYDILGKEIAILVNGFKTAGSYQVEFDATGYTNISSGIYYYKIEAGDFKDIKKMILVK